MSPSSVSAWRVHRSREPSEVLHADTGDVPEPEDDRALIAVNACRLNFDVLQCRGLLLGNGPMTVHVGYGGGGDGRSGGGLLAGLRVIAMPELPHGGLMKFCVAPSRNVFVVPDEMPTENAAGS